MKYDPTRLTRNVDGEKSIFTPGRSGGSRDEAGGSFWKAAHVKLHVCTGGGLTISLAGAPGSGVAVGAAVGPRRSPREEMKTDSGPANAPIQTTPGQV